MTTEYVFEVAAQEYVLVSTTEIGAPGPPGADGSGLPGIEIKDLGINPDGEVSFEWLSHFGINAQGEPYYSSNPATIPAEDMAWYDVVTNSITRGLPGAASGSGSGGAGLRARGVWQPNTTYAADDWFSFGGSSYAVVHACPSA
jgi:hypothetical protein